MRGRLIWVFLAVSSTVAVAFVVPLAFLVRGTAADRAIDAGRTDAAAIVPALAAGATRDQIESAVGATTSGRAGRMSVITDGGWIIGSNPPLSVAVDQALATGRSSVNDTSSGGVEVVTAVSTGPSRYSVIRVDVPRSSLNRGITKSWLTLAGVGLALVAISVLVADRLARTVVRPTEDLAAAARRLGSGDLSAQVDPDGPPELIELAGAFNALGTQVSSMIERERELVAELSHRLRTPLTKLRLRLDQLDDNDLHGELRQDLDGVTVVLNDLIREARGSLVSAGDRCQVEVVVADRATFWQALAEDQGRPWIFKNGLTTPTTVAMSTPLLQAAVDVLIENVFAHTDEGVAMVVATSRVGSTAFVWVEDAGPGLSPQAFGRGSSNSGSTGLGLDIARRTVEAVGGGIELLASDLGGAKVRLALPTIEVTGPR